jgi:hypothetical protein
MIFPGILHQVIDLRLGKAVNLAQFPYDRAVPEGGNGAQQGRVLFPVPLENVIEHLVAFLPGVVDVEVRGTRTFGVDEALEVKVELNGVNIGDLQAVSHHGIRPAPASYVVESAGHGIAYDVPCDQEIGRESQAVDNLQLMPDPAAGFRVVAPVAVKQPVHGQLLQQELVVVAAARETAFVLDGAEVKTDAAVPQQRFGIPDDLRVPAESLQELAGGTKMLVPRSQVLPVDLAEQGVVVHRPEMRMDGIILPAAESHRLAGKQPVLTVTERRGDEPADLGGPYPQVLVVEQLGRGPAAEGENDVCVPEGRWVWGKGLLDDVAGREEFVQFPEPFVVACNAGVEQPVPVAELDPRDRVHPVLAAGHDEIHYAHGIVDVGQGQGGDSLPGGLFDQGFHGHGAVAQTVI